MTNYQLTLEQKIQRALDVQEIQNVIGKHVFYHALGRQEEDLDANWVKKAPEPTFALNHGYYVGYESLYISYVKLYKEMQRASLASLRKRFPELEDTEENLGAGTLLIHPLTTPIIEVAGDGQTAKGVWYSPGQATEIRADGKPVAEWSWGRFGVDFAKEDGAWKIWHLHLYLDFSTEVGKSWTDDTEDAPVGVDQPPIEIPGPPRPDRAEETYKFYSMTQVPQDAPRMPEPYSTFSETFSY